jgi:signal recognition particle subunit SRP54
MSDMMKKIGKTKGGLAGLFGGAGGMPQPDPAMLEQMQKGGLGSMPGGFGGMGGMPGLPKGLPGLGGSGGFPGMPGKKK